MSIKILGVSGSSVKNSNTDRMIKHILVSSGLKSEFVKLSSIDVRPCRACKKCVGDNICKVRDDFPALAPVITNQVSKMIAMEMNMDRMDLIGQIEVMGNMPCLSCGQGGDCEMSTVPLLYGENAKATSDNCIAVEDQIEILKKAETLGRQISKCL